MTSSNFLDKWNYGTKDFRLQSTGEAWKLAHVQPFSIETPHLGSNLRQAALLLQNKDPEALACFAIDERLTSYIQWLAKHGILTDTLCTIYSVSFFAPSLRKADFVTLSTGDI